MTVNGLNYHDACSDKIADVPVQEVIEEVPGVSDFLAYLKNDPASLIVTYFNGYLGELALLEKYAINLWFALILEEQMRCTLS